MPQVEQQALDCLPMGLRPVSGSVGSRAATKYIIRAQSLNTRRHRLMREHHITEDKEPNKRTKLADGSPH